MFGSLKVGNITVIPLKQKENPVKFINFYEFLTKGNVIRIILP